MRSYGVPGGHERAAGGRGHPGGRGRPDPGGQLGADQTSATLQTVSLAVLVGGDAVTTPGMQTEVREGVATQVTHQTADDLLEQTVSAVPVDISELHASLPRATATSPAWPGSAAR